jgi:hypothetical protein
MMLLLLVGDHHGHHLVCAAREDRASVVNQHLVSRSHLLIPRSLLLVGSGSGSGTTKTVR